MVTDIGPARPRAPARGHPLLAGRVATANAVCCSDFQQIDLASQRCNSALLVCNSDAGNLGVSDTADGSGTTRHRCGRRIRVLEAGKSVRRVLPIFARYGFKPQSAGVVSRDVSEKIEEQIILHCKTFARGTGFADLARRGQQWEVKICKGNGLTINQNAQIHGENYIVVNYSNYSSLKRIWVLWEAEDPFFTPRKPNLNLRTVIPAIASANIEVIFEATGGKDTRATRAAQMEIPLSMAKVEPAKARRKKTGT